MLDAWDEMDWGENEKKKKIGDKMRVI